MIPFNPLEKLMVGLLALGLAFGAGFYKGDRYGSDHVQVKWDQAEAARKAAEAAALAQRVKENQIAQEKENEINRQVSAAAEQAVVSLHVAAAADRVAVDAAGGLRDPGAVSHCPALPAEAASTGQPDDAVAGTGELSRQAQDELWAEADRADEIVERYRQLEEWAVKNGFYNPPP